MRSIGNSTWNLPPPSFEVMNTSMEGGGAKNGNKAKGQPDGKNRK